MTSRRTSQQPTHRHTSHNQSTNAHASSSHSTDIPNRSTSRTPGASSRYNPVEDPHAFDPVGSWRPQTYAPLYMPATSSNNPSSMFVDSNLYSSAEGTSSGRMPEIRAPVPQSFAHAARWPLASSSSSSWNLPLPGPPPQRPPLPSRHATPRPHAPPPPTVPPLPYPQQSHAGPSGPSLLQSAGPSTSNPRAKETFKPRKSTKDSKKGPAAGYMHKFKLNPIPRIMGSLKTKSGSVVAPSQPPAVVQDPRHGGYRDTEDIQNDDDDNGGGLYDVDDTVNVGLSAKEMKQAKDTERSSRHRAQIKGLKDRLEQLLWPENALSKNEPSHTNAQCLERAIEWIEDSVRNADWQKEKAILEERVRDREEAARRFQIDASRSADIAMTSQRENVELHQTILFLQQRLAEYSRYNGT